MFMEERRTLIIDCLLQKNKATVNYLAQKFNVTKETIRTDLRILANQGLIHRCHGGAIIIRKSLQSALITEKIITLRCFFNQ